MRIEYHRTLVADKVRNAAFYSALKAVIRPGETVVADIGAGTGLLGLMAVELGAKEVFLYESAEVGGLAREILKLNKARNCLLLPCHSTEMERPPRVDVVVSETLGNYPLEENIAAIMRDARKRHLKPGGIMIPRRIAQFVTPVVSARIQTELTAWDHVGYGIDYAPAKAMGLNNIYVRQFQPGDLLGKATAAQSWDKLAFDRRNKTTRSGEAKWPVKKRTNIYGLALWWSAELVDGVSLATGPLDPKTHWEQLYLPALAPITVEPGQTLGARLRSTTSYERGTNVTWTLTVHDASGREVLRQALDLEKGFLP